MTPCKSHLERVTNSSRGVNRPTADAVATCCKRALASPAYRHLRSPRDRTPCGTVPSVLARRAYSARYPPVPSLARAAVNASNPSRQRTLGPRRFERVHRDRAGHDRQSVVEDLM